MQNDELELNGMLLILPETNLYVIKFLSLGSLLFKYIFSPALNYVYIDV